jgi:hypothetical protein
VFRTFEPGTKLAWPKLNKYMQRLGVPQFDYETFKQMYDDTPGIQDIVEFDPEGVTISDPSDADVDTGTQSKADTVSKMAKRAVDLKDL